jgi:hypothetical protein
MSSERTSTNSKVKQSILKKEIYEVKKRTQEMKEEFNKDMENLKKGSNRNSGNKFLK